MNLLQIGSQFKRMAVSFLLLEILSVLLIPLIRSD